MAHSIGLKLSKTIEVQNSDVVIVVKKDNDKLGTLTLSKGSIDWLPKHAKSGKKSETQLSWTEFAALMEGARK